MKGSALPRKTVIFGNGLGMALDADYFSLDAAIGRVWDSAVLDVAQKQLICQCLPRGGERPHAENDMDKLQSALSACDVLHEVGGEKVHWLTQEGQDFPFAVRRMLYEVARSFHEYDGSVPAHFADALGQFLHQTKSHVATLNYDNLIYQPLIEREVLRGYDGALCDGFHAAGFDPENLQRMYHHDFGYYLHLHGSPLFVDRHGATVKLSQGQLIAAGDVVSSHIVLTHVLHKPSVIAGSPLLTTYWQYLVQAFQESNQIILIGYSGMDIHMNQVLRAYAPKVPIRIIEWEGAGDDNARTLFWRNQLRRNDLSLVRLPSILGYVQWADRH